MEQQVNEGEFPRPQIMEEQFSQERNDLFLECLIESPTNRSMEIEKIQKPMHSRSSKTLNRRSDFRKILNSSSSNDRLIPSSIKHDTSRQNSEGGEIKNEMENSFDSQSFRKSFKKKFEESFSVSHTIRDSSSSFSERSDSKSSRNIIIIPKVYKQEEYPIQQQKKIGCNCKRSRCLKLYCQCFQKQMYCTKNCNCHSCGNNYQNKEEHRQAIVEALARNANSITHGFEYQIKQERENVLDNQGFSLGIQPEEVKKGCKCKKTKCLKKYCECYQSGILCTIFCRCEGCYNRQTAPAVSNEIANNDFVQLMKNL